MNPKNIAIITTILGSIALVIIFSVRTKNEDTLKKTSEVTEKVQPKDASQKKDDQKQNSVAKKESENKKDEKQSFFSKLFSKKKIDSDEVEKNQITEEKNQEQKIPTPSSKIVEQKEKQAPCHTIEFKFNRGARNISDSCLQPKSVIALEHSKINKKSVCVRVNGKPVKHELAKEQGKTHVVFGSFFGPKTKVQVSYCTDKNKCNDPCKVPKDEFMSAIGGDLDLLAGSEGVQWDTGKKGKNNNDKKLNKELKSLSRSLAGEDGKNCVFKGWIEKSNQDSCSQSNVQVTMVRE